MKITLNTTNPPLEYIDLILLVINDSLIYEFNHLMIKFVYEKINLKTFLNDLMVENERKIVEVLNNYTNDSHIDFLVINNLLRIYENYSVENIKCVNMSKLSTYSNNDESLPFRLIFYRVLDTVVSYVEHKKLQKILNKEVNLEFDLKVEYYQVEEDEEEELDDYLYNIDFKKIKEFHFYNDIIKTKSRIIKDNISRFNCKVFYNEEDFFLTYSDLVLNEIENDDLIRFTIKIFKLLYLNQIYKQAMVNQFDIESLFKNNNFLKFNLQFNENKKALYTYKWIGNNNKGLNFFIKKY